MIRVLIADDHVVIRNGLEKLLSTADDIEVIGSVADGASAIETTRTLQPDVVLMDLSMPIMDGIEATRQISASFPSTHVVVLTSFSDKRRILEALRAGATGYLLKHAGADELLNGIRAAARGESPLDPKAARAMLDAQRETPPQPMLTAREKQVLSLVGTGVANKHIARDLGITERTVKSHLTSIFATIGVTSRTQAALWANEHLADDGSPNGDS